MLLLSKAFRIIVQLCGRVKIYFILFAVTSTSFAQVNEISTTKTFCTPLREKLFRNALYSTLYLENIASKSTNFITSINLKSCKGNIRYHDVYYFRLCSITEQSDEIRKGRLIAATTGVLGVNYYLYRQFKDIWWNHPRTKFHFYKGWRRTTGSWDLGIHDSLWYHVDKFGHVYGSNLISKYGACLARWSGLTDYSADWAGVLVASLLMLEIEIYDGYFEEWGFSMGDFIANEIGAFWPLVQKRVYPLSKFNLKISYHHSDESAYNQYFIEDYGGMTFWLCYDVQSIIPKAAKNIWPDFLDIALGYGTTQKADGELELLLAFDYDVTKLPTHSKFLSQLAKLLNNIHFPAPAIRITPRGKAYLLYF